MRILLAEDSDESRLSLSRFLERLGHEVTACANGEEAWQALQAKPQHLVLSDIQMPGLSGFDLLKRVKDHPTFHEILVVLFTGYGDVRSAIEAMRAGAYDYLLKPINIEELALLLERTEEYLTIRSEHADLSTRFEERLGEATREMAHQLEDARKAVAQLAGSHEIGVYSRAMKELLATARRLRQNPDLPVLIVGETGTGKELIAKYIHYGDGETTAPFVAINCAAINPNMFESELFGYEAGAFTGGNPKGQAGKLEMAQGGSLFLDEISEMGPDLQAKVLRVIQEREFYRVGGVRKIKADVRIIAASNRHLEQLVEQGQFRRDLFFRMNVGMLRIPPLRERRDAIRGLAHLFLAKQLEEGRTRFKQFSPEAEERLLQHTWPGNIRELRNVIERMVLLHQGEVVEPEHLEFIGAATDEVSAAPFSAMPVSPSPFPLPQEGFELDAHILEIVERALELHDGNRSKTARYLGISRSMLYTYLKHLEQR